MKRAMAAFFGRWHTLLAALLLGLVPLQASALCTLVCSCSVSASPLAFGNVNPLSASPTYASATIRVECGGVAGLLIPYYIDLGAGGGGSAGNRRLANGSNYLAYNLFLDSNYTQVWGDGNGSTVRGSGFLTLDVLGLSPPQTHWVYGRIPGGQTSVKPMTYTDSISVTLTYY